MLLLIFSIILLLLVSIYFFITQKYKIFLKHGVPGPKPTFPYGNIKDGFWGKRHVIYDIDDIYRHSKARHYPFVGMFMITTPYYLIIDPEIVKKILITDFKFFRNNDFAALANEKRDPLMAFNPFLLRDDFWKAKRAEVTPAMSHNKLKSMYPLILDGTKNLNEFITNSSTALDARDLSARYTCDVISNCLFGIEAKSFYPESAEIFEHSKKVLDGIMKATASILPKKMFPKDSEKYFMNLIRDSIAHRINSKIERDDFLAHVIASQKKKNLCEIETLALAWTLFMDSFETAALGMHAILYELGKDERVQKKLREEILENLNKDGKIDFEKLHELQYLDQVFFEGLRLHPPATFTTKECTESYELEGLKGHKFPVTKRTSALIPIYCLHRDAEYFPHPDTFNPERFDDDGVKAFRDKCILIPFGEGPRICVGMKYANVKVKAAIIEIVKNFELSVDDQTLIEPKLHPKEFLNIKECKLMLNFKKI